MSVPLEAGQRVTVGGSMYSEEQEGTIGTFTVPEALVAPSVVESLLKRNSQLAQRIADLQQDNADLRERLRKAERRQ